MLWGTFLRSSRSRGRCLAATSFVSFLLLLHCLRLQSLTALLAPLGVLATVDRSTSSPSALPSAYGTGGGCLVPAALPGRVLTGNTRTFAQFFVGFP